MDQGIDLNIYGKTDLIIVCVDDPKNILREAAISNGIACITITELSEDIAPTLFFSIHKMPSAPIVLASHWQAGIMTLVIKQLSTRFTEIVGVETAAVYDDLDPIGPLVESQVGSFVGRALIRIQGNWQWLDAKNNARALRMHNGEAAEGHPMSTYDVPAIGALTGAPDIRFDFVTGRSIGTHKGLAASHDLYIDMEGKLLSGEVKKLRVIISDPKGSAHLTSIGVFLIAEEILGSTSRKGSEKIGLQLPETLIQTEDIIERLKGFDVQIIEDAGLGQ
ncbi:MAG: hypothetical protein EOO88_59640 [Pedobacter sp.]|nr:MAG: hypothetical protein EOO88_59640 [Pedobacter sp.]